MSVGSSDEKKLNCLLNKSFVNGFDLEVNCHQLPEENLDELAHDVYQFICEQNLSLDRLNCSLIFDSFVDRCLLRKHVKRIYLTDFHGNIPRRKSNEMNIILYKTEIDHPSIHQMMNDDEQVNFACRWSLPHEQFESLWETLEFDLPIKCQLIQYVFTLIRFHQANIDRTLIHSNQTILLYGPPGCGKTTLSKGLAQKVSIRMKESFDRFYFYELNASSLFSKWFSQSSQNLSRFFEDILQICSDPLTFIIILIDEIESLSMSRKSSLSSNEPSDMLRVVNTLLTQIDRLKSFSNILILTTSNLIEIIDQALIDRSDLILFIGPPSIQIIFQIYRICFNELIAKDLLRLSSTNKNQLDKQLWNLAKLSQGFSGRTLRKLPIIAFSHIQQIDQFISSDELFKAMEQQLIQKKNFTNYFQQFI